MAVLDTGAEYVNAGSRMVWTGQFGTLFFSAAGVNNFTPSDLYGAISADLLNNYHLVVEKVDSNLSVGGIGSGSITLYLRTTIDRGDGNQDDGLTDIMGNVYDTFKAHGYTPISDVINQYQAASGDASTPAPPPIVLNPALPTVQVQKQNDPSNKDSGTGIDWLDKLISQAEAGSVGFVIGATLVVGLLVYLAVRPQVAVAA